MAALQNIRNKGGILVSIIIGIALIAVSFAIQTVRLRKEQRLAKA